MFCGVLGIFSIHMAMDRSLCMWSSTILQVRYNGELLYRHVPDAHIEIRQLIFLAEPVY